MLRTLPSASHLLLQDRTFDLVHLSNWEDQIIFSPSDIASKASIMPNHQEQHPHPNANPTNSALESGDWTKSIIWEPKTSFRDFTQLELNEVDGGSAEYQSYNHGKFSTIAAEATSRDVIQTVERESVTGQIKGQ